MQNSDHTNRSPLPFGIHWFRRDLRIASNASLGKSVLKTNGRTIGLFVFDRTFLDRPDFSFTRFQFFIETLKALREELRLLGSDLLVLDASDFTNKNEESNLVSTFRQLLKTIGTSSRQPMIAFSFNRDYEPFARNRDEKIKSFFESESNDQTEVITERDHLVIEPFENLNQEGKPYKVFTPFYNHWLSTLKSKTFSSRIADQTKGIAYLDRMNVGKLPGEKPFCLTWNQILKSEFIKKFDALERFENENKKQVTISIPKAGSLEAYRQLVRFANRANDYTVDRDFPSLCGTSQLSHFFKNGSLTLSQTIYFLTKKADLPLNHPFIRQLVWREFYYSLIYHFPNIEKEAFLPVFRRLPYKNNPKFFDAWTSGETGIPIVDAGMKQLLETGFMHNRLRMIVASFLVKNLNVDWRWGENFFMKHLIDGDLAPNNGGWQWAASTGCDAQPYFRIFNPEAQARKFDKDGLFIRRFLPETKSWTLEECFTGKHPIVDLKQTRITAIEMYKNARKSR